MAMYHTNTLSTARSGLPSYNAIEHAKTVRPPSTSLLCIDSEDRFASYSEAGGAIGAQVRNASPYNFSISKPETIMNGFFTRLAVSEVVFPWTIPNINVKTNSMNFNFLSTPVNVSGTITLPLGFYTPFELADIIQFQVNSLLAAGGSASVCTMTYGTPVTVPSVSARFPRFAYNVDGGTTPSTSIAFSPLTYNSTAYPYSPNTKQLFNLLGFVDVNQQYESAAVGSMTYCQATRYVDICSPQITYNQALKDTMTQVTSRDTICRVYVSAAPGQSSTTQCDISGFCPPGCVPTTIYKDFNVPKQIQWIPNQGVPGYLTFQVYDDEGDLVDNSFPTTASVGMLPEYGTSGDWSMTLLVTEN